MKIDEKFNEYPLEGFKAKERKRIDHVEFVRTWVEAFEKGEGINWVGKELGVSENFTRNLAARMRKNGVKLPKLSLRPKTRSDSLDANKLNKILEEAQNGN